MARNLKALGLALVAAVALSALMASSAQAVETFKSDSVNGKTSITATNHESKPKFTVGEVVVECSSTHLEGTAPTNSQETITLTAKTSGCTFGGLEGTVRWNHCAYVLIANTVETAGTGEKHGRVDIECSEGSQIEVEAPGFCTMKLGPQEGIKDGIRDGVVYTNVKTPGGKEELTAHVTTKNIKVKSKEGPLCFVVGNEGTLEVTLTAKGFEDTGTEETGTAKTTPSTVKEGGQVNISKG